VSYSRQPAGRVKRVTVAVLVDNMRQVGADGKTVERALTKAELDDITRLVKDAVGFVEARGDSVNVVNQPFLPLVAETLKPEVIPLWQRPWLRDVLRLTLGALVLVALALGVLRPLIKNLSTHALASAPQLLPAGSRAEEERPVVTAVSGQSLAYEQQLVQARGLVNQDPKRVAQVVKTWVGEQ
jgi:flagellar M-ring protein FliF